MKLSKLYKLLKRGIVSTVLFSILSFGCQSNDRKIDPSPSGEKYAVVCTGASMRNKQEGLADPIDKNCFWASTFRVYNELLKSGHKPENVYVLYKDGKPPFDDKEFLDKVKEIKKEFNGSYSNIATKSRLEELLNSLEVKIKPEDNFTLYLSMHGSSWGTLHFEHDKSLFNGCDKLYDGRCGLGGILEGNKSENILISVDACHAEAFTEMINHKSILIAASKRDRVGWGDRNFSCGSWFFTEMNNMDNDFNKDGNVSPYEAFTTTKERCIKYRKEIDEFLRTEYKPPEGMSAFFYMHLEHTDLIPVYREVGKNGKVDKVSAYEVISRERKKIDKFLRRERKKIAYNSAYEVISREHRKIAEFHRKKYRGLPSIRVQRH